MLIRARKWRNGPAPAPARYPLDDGFDSNLEGDPMKRSILLVFALAFAGAAMTLGGCSTTPKSEADKDALASDAESTLKAMEAADPSLRDFLQKSYGHAVFPSIGKGGLVVGGA